MANRIFPLAGWLGILLFPGFAFAQDSLPNGADDSIEKSVQNALERNRPNGFQIDASVGVSYEGNPFLVSGQDTESGAGFIQFDPSFRSIGETTSVFIGANLRAEEYFRSYDRNLSARLGLDVSSRVSSRTTLRGRVAGSTSRTSALDFFPLAGSLTPTVPPPIALPDVTFAGTDRRTSQLEAGLGLDHDITSRDRLSFDLAGSMTDLSRTDQGDFRYGAATVDYRRTISEQTSGSLSLRFSVFDYLGRTADDGITFTPTAGISARLGPKVTFDASGGASLSRIKRVGGGNLSHVAPAFRAKLCYIAAAGSTCAIASRESQPTALSGLSSVTNLAMSASRRLGARDEFSAQVSYTLNSRPPESTTAGSSADLLSISANYVHEFNRRFAGFITPSYTRLTDEGIPQRSNPGVRIGLRYRFGGAG